MKKAPYSLIPNWQKLPNICADCGTNLSVKYFLENRKICSKCFGKYLQAELAKELIGIFK